MADLGNFSSVGPALMGGLDDGKPVSFVTADSAKAIAHLGTRVTYKGEDYVYVYNASAQDASTGYGMIFSALSGYSLTISSVTGVDEPVGIVKHASILAGNYGWLCVRGLVPLAVASTMATGIRCSLGTDGVASTYVVSTGASTPFAKITSSGTGVSTTGLATAYVKCIG